MAKTKTKVRWRSITSTSGTIRRVVELLVRYYDTTKERWRYRIIIGARQLNPSSWIYPNERGIMERLAPTVHVLGWRPHHEQTLALLTRQREVYNEVFFLEYLFGRQNAMRFCLQVAQLQQRLLATPG